jgi:signal transduction histidine kinase
MVMSDPSPPEIDFEVDVPPPSILMVDDRDANLVALEAVLGPLGYRTVRATSGEEALACTSREDFAVILMDVQMPGMDGFQTVAMIKERKRGVHVPIIFVSALSNEAHHISKGYEYGAVDYLTKPFDPDILRAKVSVLVALHMQAERIARQREMLVEKRHELKLQVADREAAERANRMKDEFLAFVSHELRTPLNAIVGWTEMLVSGELDADRARRAIETIRRNAQMQALLVEDLIAMSQVVLGGLRLHLEPTGLKAVLAAALDSIRLTAEAKGVRLEAELDGADDECAGDPKRLHQVFANLLANAVKFTPAGGCVTARVCAGADGPKVEIVDTGDGIRGEALPRIFDRFWQDKARVGSENGLGLGLAIVRQLVEMHGGTVSAQSPGEGMGSTFTVHLPGPRLRTALGATTV